MPKKRNFLAENFTLEEIMEIIAKDSIEGPKLRDSLEELINQDPESRKRLSDFRKSKLESKKIH